MTNRDDFIYTAGLFDGEGTAGLYRKREKGCVRDYYYHPLVCLVNTNKAAMDWMAQILETTNHCVSRRKGKMKKTWKKTYVWFLCSIEDIIKFLSAVLPYLKIKKKQAELLLEYCKIKNSQPKKGFIYTERQHQIHELIKELNRRGPKQ